MKLIMNKNAACTIIAKNYLSYARVLAKSFLKHHPNSKFFVLVLDDFNNYFNPEEEVFDTINASDLNINNFDSFCFKYNITELCTAVKPYFLEYLFNNYDFQKLIYLDPDILVMNNLNNLYELLNKNSIILTPHITSPYNDDFDPNENLFLNTGVYNLGFVGISNTIETNNFLKWWQNKLYSDCRISFREGLFVDQKWMEFVPCFFNKFKIVKDPEYNVAYWNLHERKIKLQNGTYLVNNKPIGFFHFSGFTFDNIDDLSIYQNRFKLNSYNDLLGLFQHYKNLLIENGHLKTNVWPYTYGFFDNGFEITNSIRHTYYFLEHEMIKRFKDPFKTTPKDNFLNWLNLPKNISTESSSNKLKLKLTTNYIFKLDDVHFVKILYKIFLQRHQNKNIQEKYKIKLKNKIPKELIWFEVANSKEAKEKHTTPNKLYLYSIFFRGIIKAITNNSILKIVTNKLRNK